MIRDAQSVLAPYGPQAAEIAALAWALIAGAGVILVLVMVAIWVAVRGSASARAWLVGRRVVVLGGIVFPAVTLTALLAYGAVLMRPDGVAAGSSALRIEVTGEQWWWRVAYAGADATTVATANEVRVPVGRPVEFVLGSADVIHSFWVPSLGGKVDMIPGKTTRLRLTAEQEGVYRGQCAEYCGGAHALMGFKVVALPPAEFEAWLASEAAPAAEPATSIARRGRELFLAAGCGGCHAVRGTAASGTVGPDLTHVGRRLAVAVDTVPMSVASLARFIAEPQHVKPGSTMPPFRIFSTEDLDAVATYLHGLQ